MDTYVVGVLHLLPHLFTNRLWGVGFLDRRSSISISDRTFHLKAYKLVDDVLDAFLKGITFSPSFCWFFLSLDVRVKLTGKIRTCLQPPVISIMYYIQGPPLSLFPGRKNFAVPVPRL